MANEEFDEPEDDGLDIDIDVFVKDGEVFEVQVKGTPVRARVNDYDVEFPCVANGLHKDEDGEFYLEIIV